MYPYRAELKERAQVQVSEERSPNTTFYLIVRRIAATQENRPQVMDAIRALP